MQNDKGLIFVIQKDIGQAMIISQIPINDLISFKFLYEYQFKSMYSSIQKHDICSAYTLILATIELYHLQI